MSQGSGIIGQGLGWVDLVRQVLDCVTVYSVMTEQGYTEETLSGILGESKYPALLNLFSENQHENPTSTANLRINY